MARKSKVPSNRFYPDRRSKRQHQWPMRNPWTFSKLGLNSIPEVCCYIHQGSLSHGRQHFWWGKISCVTYAAAFVPIEHVLIILHDSAHASRDAINRLGKCRALCRTSFRINSTLQSMSIMEGHRRSHQGEAHLNLRSVRDALTLLALLRISHQIDAVFSVCVA